MPENGAQRVALEVPRGRVQTPHGDQAVVDERPSLEVTVSSPAAPLQCLTT